MAVTVQPINSISVRINQANQPIISSTSTFQGSTGTETANLAFAEANSAYALAANSLPIFGGEITGNLIVDGTITGYIDGGIFS